MKKGFIITAVVLGGAYFLWTKVFDFESQKKPRPVESASPLEQVEAVLSLDPIAVEALHSIYQKFPELVRKQLHQRTVRIEGTVHKMLVTGFKKQKIELYLGSLASPQIALVVDLDDYKLFGEVGGQEQTGWETQQGRVFLVRYEFVDEDTKPGRNISPRKILRATEKRHVFTEGLEATHQCRLRNWNASSLYFFYEPTPGQPFLGELSN